MATGSAPPQPLPDGWLEHRAPTGLVYYEHTRTHQRLFSRPSSSSSSTTAPQRRLLPPAPPGSTLVELCTRAVLWSGAPAEPAPALVPSEVADALLRALTSSGPGVSGGPRGPAAVTRAIASVGPALSELAMPAALANASVGSVAAAAARGQLRGLVSLSLRGCGRLGPRELRCVAAGCPGLRSLDVGQCAAVDAPSLAAALASCASLEVLAADHCMGVVGALAAASASLRALRLCSRLEALALACPRLQLLDLGDCWDLRELAVDAAARPAGLVEAGLFKCRALTGDSLLALVAPSSPALRYLDVSGCAALTERSLEAAARACPSLTHFVATYCPAAGPGAVAAVGSSCAALESVFLGGCPRESGPACAALAGAGASLRGVTFAPGLTGAALSAVCAAARGLVVVDLSEQELIRDDDVCALLRSCRAMRSLSISDCGELTDAALDALQQQQSPPCMGAEDGDDAQPAPGASLRSFIATNVPLTDRAVGALARRCPSLTSVDLTRNAHVSDAGIAELAGSCPQLRTLSLAFCRLVSDAALASLAEARGRPGVAPPPLALNVYGCEQVSTGAVVALLAAGGVKEVNVSASVSRELADVPQEQLRGVAVQSCNTDPLI
eukprot:m51a1_g5226 hypothetical protein (616) ;mRNA; f:276349-278238